MEAAATSHRWQATSTCSTAATASEPFPYLGIATGSSLLWPEGRSATQNPFGGRDLCSLFFKKLKNNI
jgi:hypothetical protein